MIKRISIFIVLFMIINVEVCAQTFEFEINEEYNLYNQLFDDYVSDELENYIPDEINELLNSSKVNSSNPFTFKNIFSDEGVNNLKLYILNKIELPIKSMSILITTIIICAFCSSFSSNNLQTKQVMNYICVSSVILIFIIQLTTIINSSISVVNAMNSLMYVFIPIFAGILIAALKSGVSTTFSSSMLFLCEIISTLSLKIILPFTNCFLVLSIANGLSTDSKISGIIRLIKRFAYIILSLSMVIFLAFLSIQTTFTNVVDNTASKTAKFFISSFIPIIGPSLSETLGSFRSCITLLKSSVGIYVVIVLMLIVLPKIIEITLYKLIFTVCSDISEMYDIISLKSVLDAFNQTLSLIMAVVICVCLMFVFSITIISLAGKSV